MVTLSQTPARHPQSASSIVDGQALIVLATSGEVIVLNETGAQLWAWVDGQANGAELAARLARVYDLSAAQAAADTLSFLRALVDAGALVIVGEASRGAGE
ncbi:MAG: PqqD family protein [Caldilineaceae bacterium]|nr:PqqD family protein [Caldilineaceae bacterium]